MTLQLIKQTKAQGGWIKQFSHKSEATKTTMTFSVFLPPAASGNRKVPALFFLPGITGTDELLFIKAPGAMKVAAERGIAIIATDTSPRGANIDGEEEEEDEDFGTDAGFYLDATKPKWAEHYRMYTYVTQELPALVVAKLPVLEDKHSIMGHSMGGHGALVLSLRNPEQYQSVSAFAPIAHLSQCHWGTVAFTGYLGLDKEAWKEYDATELMRKRGPLAKPMLIDQGLGDHYLHEKQLLTDVFEAACQSVGQKVTLRMQDGYDHNYFFVATFVEGHVNFHADVLLQ